MADFSLLIGRATGGFTRDMRFVAQLATPAASQPIGSKTLIPASEPGDPLAQTYAQGFAQGLATARAEALDEAQITTASGEALRFSFARLDSELSEALRQRLLATVVALCEMALAPLALDTAALASRITRAVAMFSRADDERVIRLHPDDQASVQALLPPDWTFKPDPSLTRGALRVETQSGGAEDGPEQWRQAIAEALELC
jgi:flagellar assembly protein FliH